MKPPILTPDVNKPDSKKDDIYASPLSRIPGFCFDQAVVDVFPDMIKRSVPGYEAIVAMIGELAQRYAQANSSIYDLGCSLGASLLAMRHNIQQSGVSLIGVDNSAAMLSQCQDIVTADTVTADNVTADKASAPVTLVCENVEKLVFKPASVVVLNFTLQFVAVAERLPLISRIYDCLLPGGALILSEKICFTDSHHQQLMIELHENFKRANGYSELEIAQKRSALDNVLIPETLDTHLARFEQAGFDSSDVWFQCLNFASMLAVKEG